MENLAKLLQVSVNPLYRDDAYDDVYGGAYVYVYDDAYDYLLAYHIHLPNQN